MISPYAKVHETPNGPGDARPRAEQIITDAGLRGKLSGIVILITGCSSGLGVETARALLPTGATLYLTARDLDKARAALGDVAKSDRVHLLKLDLNSLESVKAAASELLSKSTRLNVLIANAGVMMTPPGRTRDGFETQLGINHLAHFLLFNLLRPALLRSAIPDHNSRVVLLSSIAHRTGDVHFDNINLDNEYHPWVAYGQSKLANVWMANEIDRRYGAQGLHAFSVQPGPTATSLYQHMSPEDIAASQSDPALAKIFKTPEQGAATSVWAAVSKDLVGIGGKYLEDVQISKPWNPADGEWAPGHAAHAYNKEKEAKLWALSEKLVGLTS